MTYERLKKQRSFKLPARHRKRRMFEKDSTQLSYLMWIFEDYVKERLKALGVLQ